MISVFPFLGSGTPPTLQQVTDQGNTTTNLIKSYQTSGDILEYIDGPNTLTLVVTPPTGANTATFQDASGIIAYLSDVPSLTLEEVTTNGNVTDQAIVIAGNSLQFEQTKSSPPIIYEPNFYGNVIPINISLPDQPGDMYVMGVSNVVLSGGTAAFVAPGYSSGQSHLLPGGYVTVTVVGGLLSVGFKVIQTSLHHFTITGLTSTGATNTFDNSTIRVYIFGN